MLKKAKIIAVVANIVFVAKRSEWIASRDKVSDGVRSAVRASVVYDDTFDLAS